MRMAGGTGRTVGILLAGQRYLRRESYDDAGARAPHPQGRTAGPNAPNLYPDGRLLSVVLRFPLQVGVFVIAGGDVLDLRSGP